ncbi:MAG: hypothetical protein WD966_04095 [Nitrosopumilaceae archaeon]
MESPEKHVELFLECKHDKIKISRMGLKIGCLQVYMDICEICKNEDKTEPFSSEVTYQTIKPRKPVRKNLESLKKSIIEMRKKLEEYRNLTEKTVPNESAAKSMFHRAIQFMGESVIRTTLENYYMEYIEALERKLNKKPKTHLRP